MNVTGQSLMILGLGSAGFQKFLEMGRTSKGKA